MATSNEVLHWYDQLAGTIRHMLQLAQDKQWGELPALDAHCTLLVDQLKVARGVDQLSAHESERVATLIERIQADRQQLAALIQPQMARLVERMKTLERKQELSRAYTQ